MTTTFVGHLTERPNGTYALIGALNGALELAPLDPNLPAFAGHFSQSFHEILNNRNFSLGFTLNIHGAGSDGSRLTFHETLHFSVSATGVVIVFDKLRCA